MHRKFFVLGILIFITTFSGKAQIQYSFGADSNDVISNVLLDKFGNIYIAANFSNTIIIDKINGVKISSANNSQDIVILKFNALGKLIWYKKIGGNLKDEVHDFKIDEYGYLYICGNFSANCVFDNSTKKNTLKSKGKTDGFLGKYLSTSGDLDWVIPIGGEGNDDINSLSTDKFDGVLISGKFNKLIDADNSDKEHLLASVCDNEDINTAFIARYNAFDGKYIFACTIGIENNNSAFQSQSCIQADENNSFFLITTFTDEIDINPNGSPIKYKSKGKNDLILIRFDINGKIIESVSIGGNGNENCSNKCIAINKKNEVVISFSYQESCKLDNKNITTSFTAKSETDLAVIKLNNKISELIFNTSFTQNGVMSSNQIFIDDNNQIWIAGYSKIKHKTVADSKQKSVPIYVSPVNNYFILKLDNNGGVLSKKTNANLSENCAIHSIQYNCFTHDLLIGGNFNNTFVLNNHTCKSNGKKDFFIAKLKDDFTDWRPKKEDTSGILTTDNFTIDVKSNTQNTLLNIKYFGNNTTQNLNLYDYKGNKIKQISNGKKSVGLQQIFYDISYLQAGIYYVKLNDKTKWFVK